MTTFKITLLTAALFAFIACGNSAANQDDTQQSGEKAQTETEEKAVAISDNESNESKDSESDNDNESGNESSASAEPVQMDKAMFLARVFDYENNPEQWKFEGDRPCIIDFYADWCGPCKKVEPIMEDLAAKYEGKIDIYKVDTDKQKELAQVFGIQSIPSIMFCPKEGKPAMYRGAFPKSKYLELVNKHFEL
ncbi:MAG: thioredoxin [Bacteroidales bacterium]|nr:thioredoxin [Bacteroidales bacterium]MCF8326899.1 thioredoxin [Bacteroidales bacterium]